MVRPIPKGIDPNASSAAAATAEETKELTRLRNAAKRHDTYRRQRDLKIEEIHQLLLQNEEQKSVLEKEVSRIDQLIEQELNLLAPSSNPRSFSEVC